MNLPEDIQKHIYSFIYGKKPAETSSWRPALCLDFGCWQNPSCEKCNDKIWASRFDISDIEMRERKDKMVEADKHMFEEAVKADLLRFLREDEPLRIFLNRQRKKMQRLTELLDAARESQNLYEYYESDYDYDFDDDYCSGCGSPCDSYVCRYCRTY